MSNPYKIYNASAGSGKTYVLAKEYLKILLAPGSSKNYRKILAVTFTNKAVNEMKQRILGSLYTFSRVSGIEDAPSLFLDVQKELRMDTKSLQQKAKSTLKELLHNYSFFDVSTIDKFTHRIIRTFAIDLQLSQSFEVVLDTEVLLDEAVNRLLEKAGKDRQLTQVLLDFALEKIDGDKSWDITRDLNGIGKLLFDENHGLHIHKLHTKTIPDFLELKRLLQAKIAIAEQEMREAATQSLELIAQNGLVFTDFSRSSFPNYLHAIKEGDFELDFTAAWKQHFETTTLYNKNCPQAIKETLDRLHPEFSAFFNSIRANFYRAQLLKNAYSNVVPLTVLNAIQTELTALQKEQDIMLMASFNSIISNEIKDQPVPFIYERLGEKYRHYFIDEFQDTSEMQWNNLQPLIGNALESVDELGTEGSLLLVGDPKQAIYRWRGGKAEQFLNLINIQQNPFVIAPKVHLLPKNYRSNEEIIRFNNAFFSAISTFLNNPTYNALFVEGNKQEVNDHKGGLVSLHFIADEEEEEDKNALYAKKVVQLITEALQEKYTYKDICILTRSNKQGVLLAAHLMQQNIPVVSSESLLLASSPQVNFLIHLLQYSIDPDNVSVAYDILFFIAKDHQNKHRIIQSNLHGLEPFLNKTYNFNIAFLRQFSVYDGLEYAIRQFNLAHEASAYLSFLLDAVLEVEQREGTNIATFLSHWEQKKEKLSVVAPQHIDAVQIMTIHKSKGLEFPIVIFPFANSPIYPKQESKLWLPVSKDQFNGFEDVLITKKNEVLSYNADAAAAFTEEHHKTELDALNVLYVALTRPEKALHIIAQKKPTKGQEYATDNYAGLFIYYLQQQGIWNEDTLDYSFGALPPNHNATGLMPDKNHIPFPYSYKERPAFQILAKSGSLWENGRQEALDRGNLIHQLLSLIDTAKDVDKAIAQLLRKGDITANAAPDLKQKVRQILFHPLLEPYFTPGNTILKEKDIITKNGLILRPDRLVIQGQTVTLIDFKTGKSDPRYYQQVATYAFALKEMGFTMKHNILVYINDNITPEFI